MEQKKLKELHALYQLEPELRDIYVEGSSDVNFFRWYLNTCGIKGVDIYPVDDLDIPEDIVLRHSLPRGSNKWRLVALSYELANTPASDCVMCIADRDFDAYGIHRTNSCLQWTDGNSLESYALRSTVFRKFLFVALDGFVLSPEDLFDQCVAVLERIYSIRTANEVLGWGMSWVSFKKYVNIVGISIGLLEDAFIKAYLQTNKRWGDRECFVAKVNEIADSLDHDPMRRIRGHDLSKLLYIVINKLCKEKKFGDFKTLESCLLATVEAEELRTYSLFREIEAFCDGRNSNETDG